MRRFPILLLFAAVAAYAQVRVAFFPLNNRTSDLLHDWIGYSVPEYFFRAAAGLSGMQAWEPVFLFAADSSGWDMGSDSLLMNHKTRWRWDYAVGGEYGAAGDSVVITLKIVREQGNRLVSRKKKAVTQIPTHRQVCANLFFDCISMMEYRITPGDSLRIRQNIQGSAHAYATYAMGYGFEMRGEPHHALSAYHRALELEGSFVPALYRVGMLYSQARNKEEARIFLQRAAAQDPNSSVIAAEAAILLIQNKEPDKAIAYINARRNLLEQSVAGMRAIGLAYLHNGEYRRAVAILTRAVAAGPADLETDFVLAQAYLSLGRFTTAAEIFGRLITYRPRHTRYYTFLGQAYREAGRLMESADVLESAMKLDPENVPNLINLANTCFRLGWYRKAEQYLMRAKKLDPDMGEILINLGVLYWHVDKKSDAKKMMTLAQQKKIAPQSALNNQATMLFLTGDTKKAIARYKQADKYGKKSETILYNLGIVCMSAGRDKEAASYFNEVLSIAPERIDVLTIQAQLALRRENFKDAETHYRKILDLSPGDRATVNGFTEVLEKQERFDEAVAIIEGYLVTFPQDMAFRLKLPDMYRKKGWYEVALSQYENMQRERSFADHPEVYLGMGRCRYDIIRFKGGRDYERAIYDLKKAAALDSRNPEPDIIIGSIYLFYRNYRELAMAHLNTAYTKATTPDERKRIKDIIAGKKE